MTDLFNQNLTEPNWYKNGNYLKSHSVNYYDTKHKYITTTTDFSLYYATVDLFVMVKVIEIRFIIQNEQTNKEKLAMSENG